MTIPVLYDYQQKIIADTREALRTSKSVLVVAPTGSGKSVITAAMFKSAISKGKTAYFCVHRKDLVTQMAGTFKRFNIPFGYIASGRTRNPCMPVQICSVQTLANRIERTPAPDVLVVDEAHFSCSKSYSRIIDLYKLKGTVIIGKTASPSRLSGEGLGKHFSSMVVGPTVKTLMDDGFLSKYKIYAPSAPVLTGIKTRAGDYVEADLLDAVDKPSITGDAVTHYLKYANGMRTVAFCVSITHSEHVAQAFRSAGINAQHVDYKTKPETRMQYFNDFADGKIKILTSVAIFSEGLDLAALVGREVCIEAAILLRPTKSLTMYLQQVGRALRKKDYHAVILDHAGNCREHGLPDEEREWQLSDRQKAKKSDSSDEKEERVKICPECYMVHEPDPKCPECGFIYPVREIKPDEIEGDLEEIDIDAERLAKKKQQGRAESLPDLVALGASRGYKNPRSWARHVYNSRVAKRMSEKHG